MRGSLLALSLTLVVPAGCVFQSGSSSSLWNQGRVARTVHAGSSSRVDEATILAGAGRTVVVTYDATVEAGSLTLEVRPWTPLGIPDPYERVRIDRSGAGELRATVDGMLSEVRIRPFGLRGSYEVSWHVE